MSENESVVRAARGEPVKKLVVVRSVERKKKKSKRTERDEGERRKWKGGREGWDGMGLMGLTLEVLKQICNSFTLILEKKRFRRVGTTRTSCKSRRRAREEEG